MVHVFFRVVGLAVIAWPNADRLDDIREDFRAKSGGNFPGIVGAVDGSHIAIKAPTEDPLSYVNRKGFHSVILQGIYNHELLFFGWPGSVHDARVFRMSHIASQLEERFLSQDMHLVGDSACLLKTYLMVPFKGALTAAQQRFNTALSKRRQCMERAFGMLKCRWRRLKYLDASNMPLLVDMITTCAILHNLCLLSDDTAEDLLFEDVQAADVECEHPIDIPGHSSSKAKQSSCANVVASFITVLILNSQLK